MADTSKELADMRQQINSLDQQLQDLIIKRAQCVEAVGKIKQQDKNAVYYRPEREAMVLNEIMKRNTGPLAAEEMAKIFRAIMSACLALQKPMEIAFLGPEGTFSEIAAKKHFGPSLINLATETIPQIFAKVTKREADYGVVPIENSIGGLVNITLDQFIDSSLKICGEVNLAIHQNLLRHPKATKAIKKIYSHQQSLWQCNKWLQDNYPEAEQMAVSSNAQAAKQAQQELAAAAIASDRCADIYDLKIIEKNIEDEPNNQTRFLIIGYNKPDPSLDDRTSLLIRVTDAPGVLERLINPFAQNGINMTMIRSRQVPNDKDAYYFFLDLDVHQQEARFIKTMQILEKSPMLVKVLGSYPKAVL